MVRHFVLAGGLMAGSVATLAILWVSLQTMGFLGSSHTIGAYKLPMSLQNYLASYTGKSPVFFFSQFIVLFLFVYLSTLVFIEESFDREYPVRLTICFALDHCQFI